MASPVPRPSRLLHPAAWWGWALALAVAATRVANPWLLALTIGVLAWVCAVRREPGAGRVFVAFLVFGAIAVVLRLTMTALLGSGRAGTIVVVSLPVLPLPSWFGGIRLGGLVMLEPLVAALYEGLQLAAVLAAVGAAGALATPRRLLRYVPATLYDVGTMLVVGLTYAPALVEDAMRMRRARALRGGGARGLRGRLREAGRLVVPVLAGALDDALALAASMESRGYGRGGGSSRGPRASALALLGLTGVLIGAFGLLSGVTSRGVGVALLALGVALSGGTLLLGARHDPRSRYRRQRWSRTETAVLACGLAPAVLLLAVGPLGQAGGALSQAGSGVGSFVSALLGVASWRPATSPLSVPDAPLLPVLALLVAALPGAFAPPVPRGDRRADVHAEAEFRAEAEFHAEPVGGEPAAEAASPAAEADAPRVLAPAVVRGTATGTTTGTTNGTATRGADGP